MLSTSLPVAPSFSDETPVQRNACKPFAQPSHTQDAKRAEESGACLAELQAPAKDRQGDKLAETEGEKNRRALQAFLCVHGYQVPGKDVVRYKGRQLVVSTSNPDNPDTVRISLGMNYYEMNKKGEITAISSGTNFSISDVLRRATKCRLEKLVPLNPEDFASCMKLTRFFPPSFGAGMWKLRMAVARLLDQ